MVKDILESGIISAFKVGQCFNKITNYDLSVFPGILGNYSWYGVRRGETLLARKPWHQFVDIKEAQDLFRKVELLK